MNIQVYDKLSKALHLTSLNKFPEFTENVPFTYLFWIWIL